MAIAACAPALAAPPAEPLSGPLSGHASAQLVAEFDSAAPGAEVPVGLRLEHEPHWHTYWIVPGDAGLPTQVKWQLPAGAVAGPLQWPVPQLLRVGPLANFGYEGTVLLPLTLRLPAQAGDGSTFTARAHASWLVCSDVCIPESADLTLNLPVRAGAGSPSRWHDEFVQARARIPQALALPGASALIDGSHLRLQYALASPADAPRSLHFFPLEDARLQAAAPQPLAVEGGQVRLDLAAAAPVDAAFRTLRGVLVAGGGPGAGAAAGAAALNWAGVVELPLVPGKLPAVAFDAAASAASPPSASAPSASPSSTTLWVALIGAFLGGLILNLMPCVFPVLSLKLLALVQHRHRGDPSLSAHGLAFTAGTVASFVALAGVLVALRSGGAQLGWGFQLQSPVVVALLTALFFGIGLNLLGAFDVALGTAMINSEAVRAFDGHHLRGSFATGVLAVVVASPCTAPFMGAALGFAITAPSVQALGVFAALGLGMATPYLALTMSPALLQRLPRPGAWMQQLRQLMAFPMFATCVWLLWVLAQQVDVDDLAIVLVSLVGLGLAAWAAGQAQRGARRLGWLGAVAAVASVGVLVSATGRPVAAATPPPASPGSPRADAHGWADWSPAAQQGELALGHPVFVDFTAAWCVTCQANKRIVLYRPDVVRAFAAHGVTRLRADWTNRNDTIGRELARYQRSGVPLYVLYDAKGQPQVLPEILTESIVLEALGRI